MSTVSAAFRVTGRKKLDLEETRQAIPKLPTVNGSSSLQRRYQIAATTTRSRSPATAVQSMRWFLSTKQSARLLTKATQAFPNTQTLQCWVFREVWSAITSVEQPRVWLNGGILVERLTTNGVEGVSNLSLTCCTT